MPRVRGVRGRLGDRRPAQRVPPPLHRGIRRQALAVRKDPVIGAHRLGPRGPAMALRLEVPPAGRAAATRTPRGTCPREGSGGRLLAACAEKGQRVGPLVAGVRKNDGTLRLRGNVVPVAGRLNRSALRRAEARGQGDEAGGVGLAMGRARGAGAHGGHAAVPCCLCEIEDGCRGLVALQFGSRGR